MKRPSLLFCLGEPRPGFKKLWDVILGTGVEYRSYCAGDANGHDLVTDVPFTIPPLEMYCHGAPLIHLESKPAPNDEWGLFRYHHATLYRSALATLTPQPAAIAPAAGDAILADLVVALYAYPGAPEPAWDHLEPGTDDGVYWAYKRLDGEGSKVDAFTFRGSTTDFDWVKDALAVADTPHDHPELGPIHPGFFLGIPATLTKIAPLQREDAIQIFLGHSLGAGQACLASALACVLSQ